MGMQPTPPVPRILSGQAANLFLTEVQNAIYEQQSRISVLNQSILQQHGIAKGRYLGGNVTGACLAMKKAKKMERERNLTLQAMDLAMQAAVEIQVSMHSAGARAAAAATGDANPPCYRVDIGDYCKVLTRIHHIMLERDADLILGRKLLVEMVEKLL